MSSTAVPTPSQPAGQPPRSMLNCAMSGSITRPDICATVAMPLAKVRRATNQLLTTP